MGIGKRPAHERTKYRNHPSGRVTGEKISLGLARGHRLFDETTNIDAR
jgi:hypothetical protein